MRRALSIILVVALSACAGAGTGSRSMPSIPSAFSVSQSVRTASTNWNVETGGSTDKYALQALDYYPNEITIDAGDTITYHVASGAGGDAHTVSFVPAGQKIPSPLDPKDVTPAGGTTITGKTFVNSGILVGGQTFTLRFPVAGTYRILCLFHEPAMETSVVVHKAGSPYPHNAQYYRDIGNAQMWSDLAAAEQSVSLFPFKQGGTTLAAGIDPQLVQYPPTDLTVLRFLNTANPAKAAASGNLTVKVNTVVTFINETSNEPHTVSLNVEGKSGVPNIPPDPPVNAAPHGVTTDDGTKVVNSGTFLGGQSFQVMFTKAGTYVYGCIYHANSGMDGTITVTQ